MAKNHKHRDIRYRGFIIGLDYDPGDYVGIEPGWVYSVINDATGLDYGGSSSRMPFYDAVRDGKITVDEAINEIDDFVDEKTEFSGDDDDYLREEEDPCREDDTNE